MLQSVQGFVRKARCYYYAVVLARFRCPQCQGMLEMIRERLCRCTACDWEYDPTLEFQGCGQCGARPRLRIRRYECSGCRSEVVSQFLFDGLVFDPDYFRQKMAESRSRKIEQRERVRVMLAECRSLPLNAEALDATAVADLTGAFDRLTGSVEIARIPGSRDEFDLRRYQRHIRAHLGPFPVALDELPPVSEDVRIDRIWRFIAIIFLAHAGIVDIWQEGQTVMVKQLETDREGQDVFGDLESSHGVEGALG